MEDSNSINITILIDIVIPLLTVIVSIILAYFTTRWTIRNQYNKGKYQFLEICNRYFINAYNCIDIDSVPQKTKTEPIDKVYQLEELKAIHENITKLLDNPYYLGLLKQFPEISMINTRLRREIIDLKNADKVILSPDNIDLFYKIYQKIKIDIPSKLYRKNDAYRSINEIIEHLNHSMEDFKTRK